MAPALRIPMQLDMESFQQQTQRASDRVGEVLKLAARQFANVNGEMLGVASTTAAGVGLAWSQSMTRNVLVFAGWAAASVAAIKLVGAAIEQAREQLRQMVEIADKARDTGVSGQFLQGFRLEARKLQVEVTDLDAALQHAFEATKDKSPIDLSKWEIAGERVTEVEKALRVYNETLAKAAGTQLSGLVLFRDAKDQEARIVGVLQAMKELEAIGQRAAALDIGEKMFGAQFVERIRQGRTSVDGMLDSIHKASSASNDIFSEAVVKRAKDIDDQLKLAQDHLSRELKPTWESLANILLSVKSLWADIIELMAKAAGIAGDLTKGFTYVFGGFGMSFSGSAASTPKEAIDQRFPRSYEQLRQSTTRGAGPPPKLKETDREAGRDRFEASADSIEKRTAALEAETANINLNTAARERARIAAELETVAKQINKEAGLGTNVVTVEQRQRIDELAEAYGRAAAAIEQAHSPLATFARESANLNRQLNAFGAESLNTVTNELASVVTGTRSVSDAFKSMTNSILQDLARIAIRKAITGPLAEALGSGLSAFMGGGGVPLPGSAPIGQGGIGHNAQGTDNWRGGPTWVGENGPEIINLPKGAQVIPAPVAARAGGTSSGNTYIDIKNFTDQKVDSKRQRFGQDEFVEISIGAARNDMADGGFDSVMQGRFGLRPVTAMR